MLQVDLSAGRFEIVQSVTRQCSAFGEVGTISIFLESSAIAMIEMANLEQTEAVATKFHGKLVRDTAFVELAQVPGFETQMEAA